MYQKLCHTPEVSISGGDVIGSGQAVHVFVPFPWSIVSQLRDESEEIVEKVS